MKFHEKHWAAIAYLSQPKRAGLTYKEIAERVGVAEKTLFEWKKKDEFNEEVKKQVLRNTIDRLPEIMDSVPDHIIEEGNAAMFRTLLQALGMLSDKVEVEDKRQGVDIAEIKAKVDAMTREKNEE